MQKVYEYEVAMASGRIDRGTVDAESSDQAREILATRGWLLVSLAHRGERRAHRDPISASDLAIGLRILADLLDSGISVGRALQAFDDLAPKPWRAALPGVRESIREGRSLADALANASIEVPPLVIGIARAGEAGAGLAPAMRRAAELTEAAAETQSAVRAALAYPVVVAVAGAAAITVLLTVVLPRFAKILADLGQKLPASTQLVIQLSSTARHALLPSAIGGVVATGVWKSWVSTDAGRRAWHRLLLGVPLVGDVRRGAATARVAHSLGALLESGVAVSTALAHSARASGDAELERRLMDARGIVSSGQPLSRALESTDALTPTTIRLIRAGEDSGRLAAMLEHAARIEQARTDRMVRTAVRMLEPMLLLTFASMVALVAAALLQAIYSVRPTA
jgi:general secretion pathway protein F